LSDFAEALNDRLLICDGAMGTMLHAAGNSLDRTLPELNLSNPDLVSTVHNSYVGAGVDVILTNTFGASRLRLAEHGYAAEVIEINRAAVRLATQAAAAVRRPVFVGGSVSPAVSASQRSHVPKDERVDAVREQVLALADAGVDLLVLETFGFLDELLEAVRVAAEVSDLPILAQVTFTSEGHTPGGESPHEVASALARLPVTALGANCTVGPQRMLDIVERLRRHTDLPISAQPNAGLPRRVSGRRFEYSLDGDYFANYARRYAQAGASMIGGCCGTTPAVLRAVVAGVSTMPRRPAQRAPARPAPEVFAQQLTDRGFVVAAEIAPPSAGSMDTAADTTAAVRAHSDLVLVSAGKGTGAQLSSTSVALHLQHLVGVETIATITTWDKTIMSLQADLLGAHAFGIRTVVCEKGNPPLRGDYPNADGIWEVDSTGLIELVAGLNAGRDCNGLALATKTSFRIGARCNPGSADLDKEIARTRAKIAAGAEFLITRPVYELDNGLRCLLDELRDVMVPVLVTVSPLSGFAEAEYLAYEVPDVAIPKQVLAQLEAAGTNGRETGAKIAADLVAQARKLCQGIVVVLREDADHTAERLLAALHEMQNPSRSNGPNG
jgi:methionine synthase / methylenetetrahydrofolate reductase(NADPH)